jgi:uncharacterized protein (TIGR00297 family)
MLAAGVSAFGWRKGWLTASGAWAAFVVGACVFGTGDWHSSIPLLLFFFSANLLPKLLGKQDRSEKRTAMQVVANGGVGAACCLLAVLDPEHALLWWGAYAASIAEATGDTWATEIGTCLGGTPRLITSLEPVPKGTSGAISWMGTLATVGGVMLIAIAGSWSLNLSLTSLLRIIIAGTSACMMDSLLGATLQARFECAICSKQTESAVHCSQPARLLSGWRWLDNSRVNFVCTLLAAVVFILCS